MGSIPQNPVSVPPSIVEAFQALASKFTGSQAKIVEEDELSIQGLCPTCGQNELEVSPNCSKLNMVCTHGCEPWTNLQALGLKNLAHLVHGGRGINTLGIPQELKELPQWVCWRLEERKSRNGEVELTKPPVSPHTGRLAKVSNSKTWGTFEEAHAHFLTNPTCRGVGFVFTQEDPYAGVDLDKCRDPETGHVEGWAQEIIDHLDSWTELSQSGRGFHVIVRGSLPPGARNRKGQVEMYDSDRYFALTGDVSQETPWKIEDRQAELQDLHREIFGENSHSPHTSTEKGGTSVEVLLERCRKISPEKFPSLWAGDLSQYDGNHSRADLALANILAKATGYDTELTDRLFRQSRLMRKKVGRKEGGAHLWGDDDPESSGG